LAHRRLEASAVNDEQERAAPGHPPGLLTDEQWQTVQIVSEALTGHEWSTELDRETKVRIMDEVVRRFPDHWPPANAATKNGRGE
jgi:hypothetical protein